MELKIAVGKTSDQGMQHLILYVTIIFSHLIYHGLMLSTFLLHLKFIIPLNEKLAPL